MLCRRGLRKKSSYRLSHRYGGHCSYSSSNNAEAKQPEDAVGLFAAGSTSTTASGCISVVLTEEDRKPPEVVHDFRLQQTASATTTTTTTIRRPCSLFFANDDDGGETPAAPIRFCIPSPSSGLHIASIYGTPPPPQSSAAPRNHRSLARQFVVCSPPSAAQRRYSGDRRRNYTHDDDDDDDEIKSAMTRGEVGIGGVGVGVGEGACPFLSPHQSHGVLSASLQRMSNDVCGPDVVLNCAVCRAVNSGGANAPSSSCPSSCSSQARTRTISRQNVRF